MKDWFWKQKKAEAKPEPTTIESHRSSLLPFTVRDALNLGTGKKINKQELHSLIAEQFYPEATYLVLKALNECGNKIAHKKLISAYVSATDRNAYDAQLREAFALLPTDMRVDADKLTRISQFGFDETQEYFAKFFASITESYTGKDQVIVLAHAPLIGIRKLIRPTMQRFIVLTSTSRLEGYYVTPHTVGATIEELPSQIQLPSRVIVADDMTATGTSFQKVTALLTQLQPDIQIETKAMVTVPQLPTK